MNLFEVFISKASVFVIRREGNLEVILISTRSPKRGNSSADPPVLSLWEFYVRFYVFWPYLTVYNTIYYTAIYLLPVTDFSIYAVDLFV